MNRVPSYGKVMTLGSAGTQDALRGPVIVQEKVDGSQFGFGIDDTGHFVFRSKGADIHLEAIPKMFELGVHHVNRMLAKFSPKASDIYFFGEYLNKPKHNALSYERVPKGNIVLFDGLMRGAWVSRDILQEYAQFLEIDLVPELYNGELNYHEIGGLLDRESYLGKERIEGVVIKNYAQTITINGHVQPMICKVVREDFKERNSKAQREFKGFDLNSYIMSFNTEARFQKAWQHLNDAGKLEQQPKDISQLIIEVQRDLADEESENIKHELYRAYIKDIMRNATRGLPEWYKEKLIKDTYEQTPISDNVSSAT
jgi:hypothetical protein